MKVAIYTGTFVKDQDGVSRTLYHLVDEMLSQGMEVSVWSPAITEVKKKGLSVYKTASIPFPLYKDYKISVSFRKMKRQLQDFSPDIIHISTPDYLGFKVMRYGLRKKIPVVAIYHTDFPSYLSYYHISILSKPIWIYLRYFYGECTSVYTPTEEIQRRLKDRGIKNVGIWGRGVDTSTFNPSKRSKETRKDWKANEKLVFLYVGRFVWYKDLDVIVGVHKMLEDTCPEKVRCVFVGSGPIEKCLKESMPSAVFTGYLKGDELAKVYASSDVFLFPSTTETFGNVVQEAISSGLPAIVSNVGGCQEIVKKSGAGVVCQAKNVDEFFKACVDLSQNNERRSELSRKGLYYSQNNSWTRVNSHLVDQYRSLVRSFRR
jgi:phosphatidylinositol alpha 1,6-mannosyltransferase